jgi:hypothetical protein
MRVRAALIASGIALLAWGGTAYADGAPVAGVATGGQGVAWGAVRYVALPTHGGTAVAQIDRATGEVNGYASLRGGWGIPQVAFDGSTAGISAGGGTLVLGQMGQPFYRARSRFALVNPVKMRLQRIVTLRGAFFFDAVSPDGQTMYLIQLPASGSLLRYAVRAYDLRHDRLLPDPVVDKTEPDERMAGMPMARATSADGVWAYTLYYKPGGRLFIHALNTQAGVARCIDLPRLASHDVPKLSIDGGRLDLVAQGHVLAVVDRSTFEITRSPAPETRTAAPHPKPTPARHTGSDRTALTAGAIAGGLVLVVACAAALAVRRRRPARAGSGGAAAGAPSGP